MSSKLGDGTCARACIHWSRSVRAEFLLLLLSATTYRLLREFCCLLIIYLTLRVFVFGGFILYLFWHGALGGVLLGVLSLYISPSRWEHSFRVDDFGVFILFSCSSSVM